MHCFKHPGSSAVAVCRHCFKGVCAECALPFDDGVACSERCLEKAKMTAQVVANGVLAQTGLRTGRYIGPALISLVGAVFLGWAGYCHQLMGFTGALGAVFVATGITLFVYNRKYFKPINRNGA